MSTIQAIPKNEIQPGDRVSIVGQQKSVYVLPEVVRIEGRNVIIKDEGKERMISPDEISGVMRLMKSARGS